MVPDIFQLSFAVDKNSYTHTIPLSIKGGGGYAKVINVRDCFKVMYQEVQSDNSINIRYNIPMPDRITLGSLSLTGKSVSNLHGMNVDLPHLNNKDAYWGHVPGESCGAIIPGGMLHRKVYISVSHSLFDETWRDEPNKFSSVISGNSNGLFHTEKLSNEYFSYLNQIIMSSPGRAVDWLQLESSFLSMMSSSINQFSEDSVGKKTTVTILDQELSVNVARILRNRIQEPPGLVELARLLGTNEFKLKKVFKEVTGYTVFEYLRKIRMEKAAQLLIRRDRTIMHIAQSVGYQNQSSFTKAFRLYYGMNPSDYQPKQYYFTNINL